MTAENYEAYKKNTKAERVMLNKYGETVLVVEKRFYGCMVEVEVDEILKKEFTHFSDLHYVNDEFQKLKRKNK